MVNLRRLKPMKISALVTALNISESSVRNYATQYSEYLSPSGMGGGGKHRDFTDHDARVLKLVRDMKFQNIDADNIEITLRSLQQGGWERLPPLDGDMKALIPSPGAQIEAQAERAVLVREIELLREQIADLKAERADRDELVKKLAEAETMIKLYESGRLKPPGA
jgi:DNA-binding transcriptional MerR regulator